MDNLTSNYCEEELIFEPESVICHFQWEALGVKFEPKTSDTMDGATITELS